MTLANRKKIGKLAVALLLVCALIIAAMPSLVDQAHADGYTVSGTLKPNGTTVTGSKFTLYKVGKFDHDSNGKSIFVLDSKLNGLPAGIEVLQAKINSINKDDYSSETEWQEAWLDPADTLAEYITSDLGLPQWGPTAISGADGNFSFPGSGESAIDNGLYLLTGTKTDKVANEDGSGTYYQPRPMFVMVLNGNVQVEAKATEEKVESIQVLKKWVGDEDVWKDKETGLPAIRPVKVEVDLEYTDSEDAGSWTKWGDTIVLTKDNNYASDVMEIPSKLYGKTWRCVERMGKTNENGQIIEEPSYYYVDIKRETQGDAIRFNLTNTYKPFNCTIKKTTPEYVKHNETVTTSVVFELKGYDVEGNLIYHANAGMNIPGPGTEEITVENIPRNLDKLMVKESYSGSNYTPNQGEDGKEATVTIIDADTGDVEYNVEFNNKYDDTIKYDSGIVNKFERDEDGGYKIIKREGSSKDGNSDDQATTK